jgi:hypothetical protein
VEHLFGLIKPNGKFVYAHEFGDKSREFDGYNLLRDLSPNNDPVIRGHSRRCRAISIESFATLKIVNATAFMSTTVK